MLESKVRLEDPKDSKMISRAMLEDDLKAPVMTGVGRRASGHPRPGTPLDARYSQFTELG